MALTEIPSELSSTPSIVDGGNATAITIDSSENVLVGTTATDTAAVGFRYRSSLDAISSVADGGISAYFGRRTSDGDIVAFRKNDDIVGSIGTASGVTYFAGPNSSTGGFRIDSIGANGVIVPTTTVGANRDAALDLGTASARFKDRYLSGGVYLGGTAAGNKLNDYEEGAFTTVAAGVNGSGYNPTMRYTKVGCLVNITARILWTGTNNTSGGLKFTLPFDARATADTATGIVFYQGTAVNGGATISAYIAGGFVYFYTTAGGGFDSIKLNEVNGSYDFIFSFTYHTDE